MGRYDDLPRLVGHREEDMMNFLQVRLPHVVISGDFGESVSIGLLLPGVS